VPFREVCDMLQGLQELIAASWRNLATVAGTLLPNLLAGLFTIVLAIVVGTLAGRLTSRLLKAAKVDRAASRLGVLGPLSRLGIRSMSSLAGKADHGNLVWAPNFALGAVLAMHFAAVAGRFYFGRNRIDNAAPS